MQEVTEGVLQRIAGKIEALLLEEEEGIAKSYQRIYDGIKISIGVELDRSADGLVVNYSMNYPLEAKPEAQVKQTVKAKEIINENQTELTFTIPKRVAE